MTGYTDLATAMACDEDLLADLGRVAWAAAGLHAAVRDAIPAIPATGTGPVFSERTLSLALAELEQRARQLNPAARKICSAGPAPWPGPRRTRATRSCTPSPPPPPTDTRR